MLQINTGKLFTRGIGRTNQLTGVLYSNARLPFERTVATGAGTMRATGSGPSDLALVYDLEERIEAQGSGPGVLVSHTVTPFLDDFAVVASFGLGAVFSHDPDIVRSLTEGRPGFSSYGAPEHFVARFFDRTVYLTADEVDRFETFVGELLALDRRSYIGAMRAMRTFVAGLHRIRDDLALAYTLIVSAVESLAQDFDAFEPGWDDVEERKRTAIDDALAGAAQSIGDAVREAILSTERVSLSRRYRAFVLAHIDDGYFRQTDVAGSRPVARFELEEALRQAYGLRSAYIHQLRSLPPALALPHAHWESSAVDRRPALTFQGLYRLTRHVLSTFVANGPKLEQELYNYTLEQAGVVSMELAPQYWIWRPLADAGHARRRVEGLLSLISAVLAGEPNAELVDIRPVVADVERILPQAPHMHRPALLSLHILFNLIVSPELRTPDFDQFLERHYEEASTPGVESIVVATLLNATNGWPLEAHRAALDAYFAERVRPRGLHAPRLIEAAMCLVLAEKYRGAGKLADAKAMLCNAVETHPGNPELLRVETEFDGEGPISWRDILLPPVEEGT